MTKQEAIIAMQNGIKLTHKNFSSDEWIREKIGMYEFEDGCLCDFEEFWQFRQGSAWEKDWEVFIE